MQRPDTAKRETARTDAALNIVTALLYSLALVLSVAMVMRGHVEVGAIGALLTLTMAPIAFVLLRFRHADLRARVEELARVVRAISEQAALSDDARRVLNRQAERDMLVAAIEEDIARSNWDAAMVLIDELADRFGYRADAESLRQRVEEARRQTREKDITEEIGFLDGFLLQRRWDDARACAARIRRLYPGSPRTENLLERVGIAQRAHKQDLEARFLAASREGRTDDALGLMKELDALLSPQEAEPLRELARNVVGKARDALSAQFKAAVQDRRWGEAITLGEEFMARFPNTRMAGEIAGLLDGLRTKAASA